jgi:hypothetical protein
MPSFLAKRIYVLHRVFRNMKPGNALCTEIGRGQRSIGLTTGLLNMLSELGFVTTEVVNRQRYPLGRTFRMLPKSTTIVVNNVVLPPSSVTNGPVVGPGKRREILIEILYLEGRECQNYRTLSLMIPPLKVYTKA